ncbi:MAG: hypothetical protein J7K58_00625 [Euryarchaeota archaeon]|nr:hypothetical protein [Euryarchaeota archaeon]
MIGVIGNISIDIIVELEKPLESSYGKLEGKRIYFGGGGSAANVAYWLGLMGESVKIFGCVGNDLLGKISIESLKKVNVDTSRVRILNASTNIAIVLSSTKSKLMIRVREAGKLCDIDLDDLKDIEYLHLGSNTLRFLRLIRKQYPKIMISYDPGPDIPSLDDIRDIWAFMPNEAEIKKIFGSNYEKPLKEISYETIVIIKMLDGSVKSFIDGRIIELKALKGINVVDTTGSGDSFDAAFILTMKNNLEIQDCLNFSLAVSGINSEHFGTRVENIPWKRIIRILEDNNRLSPSLEEFIWEKLMKATSNRE